jgi:glycosyltransferase involved in cell wall biosynthesis
MNRQRVAFVLYSYPLGVSLMVINSILLFACKGFEVDVYIDGKTLAECPVDFDNPKIRLRVYSENKGVLMWLLLYLVYRLNLQFKPTEQMARTYSIKAALARVNPMLFFFSRWLKKEMFSASYKYVFPVEYLSLLAVNGLKGDHKTVYYNMELMDWKEDNPLYINKLLWKIMEFRAVKNADHVVIQSQRRAEIFARINQYELDKILILPVASMGNPCETRSSFFREKFSIPYNQTIVIYAGNFSEWACCREIISNVRYWPKNYSLVMHTWTRGALTGDYFAGMKSDALGLPVYFSYEYLSSEALVPALSSADIGLMFYRAIDDNFTEIAYSSNKLGEYLKAGLPIICSDYPSLREFVDSQQIGIAAAAPDQLSSVLPIIRGRLGEMRLNVLRCYQDNFRFERFFEVFYASLEDGFCDEDLELTEIIT